MSEYKVIKVEGKPPFFLEYQLLAPNGRLLIEVNQYAADSLINARDILNQETVRLQAELALLQDSLADFRAAAEVQSEEIGDLRGFIRSIFPLENPSDVRYANQYIQEYISKWEREKEAVE